MRRYICNSGNFNTMISADAGEWVRHDDHLANVFTLDERIKELMAEIEYYKTAINKRNNDFDELRKAYRSCRDDRDAEIAQYKAMQGGEYDLNRSEQYRMQMAGISTAALGYWKESDAIHPDYDTVALRDVARLYAKYDALSNALNQIAEMLDVPAGRSLYYDVPKAVKKFIAERNTLICDKCGIDRMKADCKLGHPVDCGISGVAQGSFPAERKDDALRQQVIATLTAIGLPSMMISGEAPLQGLRLLLEAARGSGATSAKFARVRHGDSHIEPVIDGWPLWSGIPPAIGQSIGHSIGHGEPVHDLGSQA